MTATVHKYRKNDTSSALIFIHGFTGDIQKTWGEFPEFLMADPGLSEWDIFSIGYKSSLFAPELRGLWSAAPNIQKLADTLNTNVRYAFDRYNRIAFVAHSMGGLVVQRALLDSAEERERVSHLLLFGTPSNGLIKAVIGSKFIGKRQLLDMCEGGQFITRLRRDWENEFGYDHFPFCFRAVAGNSDEFVPETSSHPPFPRKLCETIPGNHLQIVKPDSADHLSVKIVTKVLQEKQGTTAGIQPSSTNTTKCHLAKLPVTGEDLFGREKELEILDDAWKNPDTTILTLVAFGGVGKTSLVNHWLNRMGRDNFRGAGRVYGWSFYSQGAKEGTQASADEFFAQALEWFGDPDPVKGSPWDRGLRLAGLVRESRALLILDGLEPVQYPPGPMQGMLKDQGLQALTRELRQYNPGLLVITTRLAVEDIADAGTVKRIELENLSEHAGAMLLEKLGAKGSPDELKAAVKEFGGHALALNLLGRFISVVHEGDIRKRDRIGDLTEEIRHGGHARRVMASYDNWLSGTPEHDILHLMGLFDRPATGGAIRTLREPPAIPGLTDKLENLSDAQWHFALQHLRDLRLLAKKDDCRPDTLDCHPLVREHFGEKLRHEKPDAWKQAHSRLYEYFKALPEKELPDTLEEMEPLFAAVAHGCLAGKYQETWNEVYFKRIRRGDNYYIMRQLGAFGAWISVLSNFFDAPWHSPAAELKDSDAAVLLNNAGFALRAVGRLRESGQPMQAGLEIQERNEDWKNAASAAANLSELLLTLGDVARAVEYERQSVKFADRSEDGFQKETKRIALADALHQQGDLSEAESLFIEAETMQKERRPEYHYLYSVQGYQYCDLLLSWGRYAEVRERVETTLEWARRGGLSLLALALDNLSIGKSFLLQAVTEKTGNDTLKKAGEYLDRAVDGLRAAGQLQYLPLGLLARAQLHRATHNFTKAHADLEEVRELAERSEMKLFLADYHLESARLIKDRLAKEDDPTLQTGLETHVRQARKLIEETGYGRRKAELAGLESGI